MKISDDWVHKPDNPALGNGRIQKQIIVAFAMLAKPAEESRPTYVMEPRSKLMPKDSSLSFTRSM